MFKYLFVIIFLLMSVNALKTQDEIILTSEGFSYSTKITNIGTEKFSISFVNPEQKFPILSEVQIINKFGDKIAYNEENIQLKFSGIRRGYPIFNVEMTINESILNANLRFKIIYNNKINTENYNSNTFNRNFFADIVNFDHLNYINPIENEISKNQLILQSDDWFDFNVDYVKLTTKNEGVFIALLKDILQIMPAWKDKESNYINMLHLGEQYPFYLVDFDGKINDADTIYFLGQFPKGDTTYYDFYMPESAFFLFYDVNNLGRRLELSKQDNFSEEIKSVYMDKHIQKFQTFFEGTTKVGALSYNIESEWNSGFYWDRILILNNKLTSVKYNQKVPIYPSDNREDSISIFYDYTPERDVSEKTSNIIKHSYNLYANGQKIDTIGFQGRYKPYKYYSFKGALSQGLNNLGLELFNIDKDVNGNLTLESVVQFRSFDILGKQKPFAENDNLSFSIEGADNYKITTSKFKSPPVFINQSNSKIYFPKSNKSEFIAGGCENGYNPYLHSVINDIEYFYNGFALIISYRDLTLDSIITQVFKNDSYSMIELLEKIKNFPFVISSNLQTSLSEDFITKLSKIANIDGKLISPNMCWTVIKNYQDSKIVINDKRSSEVSVQNAAEGNSYSSDLITGINGIAKIFGTGINSIERAKILEVSKNNIKYENQQADILIITNPKFLNAAEKLANLRRQTLNMSAKVISTEDIYNQFNDGRLSPKAIKEFLKYSYSKWRKPSVQYAILIGSANFDSRNLLPNSLDKNNLPIYGYPSSDYWYGELDENLTKAEAEIIVGRIPAHTIDDAENYYEKAFSFYNSPVMPWHKNFLFISGGDENEGDQMRHFKEMLEFNIEYLTQDSLICDTTFIFKELGRAPISYSNQIIDEINSGAIWTTYLGHGAPTTFEIDGWNAKYLSNKNKYGVLTTVSCNTGGFQFPTVVARNEEYVLEKNKGHIAAIGSTFGSEVGETTTALQYIFEALKEKKMRRLGDMLYYAKHKILYFPRTYPLFSLLGDPLVELPISKQIDFHIENKYISFANENGNGSFIETDSLIQFKGQFYNMGYNADSVKLIVIREYQNQRDTLVYNYFNKTFSYDFEGSFKINFKPGVHTLKFIIDPYYKLIEEDKENNLVAINFEVFKNKVLPIEPLANWNIRLNNPQIRIVNPLVKAHHNEFKYEFLFIDKTTNSIIAESKSHKLAIEENYVEWIPEIQLKHNKSYLIRVKSIETVTNTESDWFELPVRADYNYKDNEVSINLEKQEIEENCQTNNLVYNESEGLTLKNVDFPFKIDSFQDTNLHSYSFRHLYMNIANHIYVADKYPSGIYIVKIPIEKKEFEPKLYHFDTWDNDGVFLKDTAWYHNNPAEQLVRFLRDSVSSDEYLFFATGSGAFRLPCIIKYLPTNKFANNIGHLDTLKKELSTNNIS